MYLSEKSGLSMLDIHEVTASVRGYLINKGRPLKGNVLVKPKLKVQVLLHILGMEDGVIKPSELHKVYLEFLESHMIMKTYRETRDSKVEKRKVYKSRKFIRDLLLKDASDYSLENLAKKFNTKPVKLDHLKLVIDDLLKIGDYHD